jgi:O-antigen/teichoic acid export membrane protein
MRRAILWTFGLTGLVTLAYILFPSYILNFLYGDVYQGAATTLTILGVAMTFFGLGGLFMQHGFATENRGQIAIIALFAVVQIALIMTFHASAEAIALDLLFTSTGLFAVSWTYMEARKKAGILS